MTDDKPKIKAALVPSRGFKRTHDRFELQLEIKVQILIPEDTFQPGEFGGKTVDISELGMKLRLDDLPLSFYTKLLSRPRYIRIKFDNPLNMAPIKITGKIASIDYHKPRAEARAGECIIGVYFDSNEGIDLVAYKDFMDSIEAT